MDRDNRAAGAGIALGAGVGGTVATLATVDVAQGIGYGVAAGILVGTLLARAAGRLDESDRPGVAILAAGGGLGLLVGGLVGVVAAWSVDEALAAGIQVGAAGGVVLGAMLGAILALSDRPETASDRDDGAPD